MKKQYTVYAGFSRLKGEHLCLTVGFTTDAHYREYSKIMEITYSIPAGNYWHARRMERVAHRILDTHYEKAIIRFNPEELKRSPNRTWEWWYIWDKKSIGNPPYRAIYQAMRDCPVNARLEMAKRRANG